MAYSSDMNSSRGSCKRRMHRHAVGNITDDMTYYSAPGQRYMRSPETSSSEESEQMFFSSRKISRQLDREKPYKNFISRLQSISNKEDCNNDKITRASMESNEHGLEYAKNKEYIYGDEQNSDILNLSLKYVGTPKLNVEGITKEDFQLNFPENFSHINMETENISTTPLTPKTLSPATPFLDFTCKSDPSYKREMAKEEPVHCMKAQKERIISKYNFQTAHNSCSKLETVSGCLGTSQPQQWEEGMFCDLCHRGPSLLLGEWFCGVCESRITNCHCLASEEHGNSNVRCTVHKMCALWSFSTHVDENGSILGLSTVVAKGKHLKCIRCQQYGATLQCSVETCGHRFHYSCADLLASRLHCTMFVEDKRFRLNCYQHRFVGQSSQLDALSTMKNQLKRASVDSQPYKGQQYPIIYTLQPVFTKSGSSDAKPSDVLIELSSDSEKEDDKKNINGGKMDEFSNQTGYTLHMDPAELINSGSRHSRTVYFIGVKLLSEDISNGCERVPIPCTNDIDSSPAPSFNYIIKSIYLANANKSYKELFLSRNNISKACKGCSYLDLDNPHKEPSLHVSLKDLPRHFDPRVDWQGQPMFGRLPYDQYGRLQVGHEVDIIECNSNCPCGAECLNKELQKGLRFRLEVYRTKNKFWSVRTTEAIARGKFVVEYAGEILTHENAHKLRGQSDLAQFSCFLGSNHQLLMTDGYRKSNVARFIRSSFQGNLEIHRVYTKVVDPRFYRIGLYATRDIEIGEELSFRVFSHPVCELMGLCFPSVLRRSDELSNAAIEILDIEESRTMVDQPRAGDL